MTLDCPWNAADVDMMPAVLLWSRSTCISLSTAVFTCPELNASTSRHVYHLHVFSTHILT